MPVEGKLLFPAQNRVLILPLALVKDRTFWSVQFKLLSPPLGTNPIWIVNHCLVIVPQESRFFQRPTRKIGGIIRSLCVQDSLEEDPCRFSLLYCSAFQSSNWKCKCFLFSPIWVLIKSWGLSNYFHLRLLSFDSYLWIFIACVCMCMHMCLYIHTYTYTSIYAYILTYKCISSGMYLQWKEAQDWTERQSLSKKIGFKFKVLGKARADKEVVTVEETHPVLHWDNRKGVMRSRHHPSKASSFKSENLFEKRETKLRMCW